MSTQLNLLPDEEPSATTVNPAPAWHTTDLAQLPCLSIRQPWAWLILNGGKDIENRNWPTRFRGRFLIHAAKGCTAAEHEDAESFAWCNDVQIPPLADLKRGGIVGVAEIVDCVKESESDWFVGNYGFVLKNVQPLEFYPCKGALGFFYLSSAT